MDRWTDRQKTERLYRTLLKQVRHTENYSTTTQGHAILSISCWHMAHTPFKHDGIHLSTNTIHELTILVGLLQLNYANPFRLGDISN